MEELSRNEEKGKKGVKLWGNIHVVCSFSRVTLDTSFADSFSIFFFYFAATDTGLLFYLLYFVID